MKPPVGEKAETVADRDVLIIDDEASVGELLEQYSMQYGWRAESAVSQYDGLDMLARNHHDLVFLDIVMPGMNVLDMISRIREISVGSEIILMSGRIHDERFISAIKILGIYGFVKKPFSIENLSHFLADDIHGGRSTGSSNPRKDDLKLKE